MNRIIFFGIKTYDQVHVDKSLPIYSMKWEAVRGLSKKFKNFQLNTCSTVPWISLHVCSLDLAIFARIDFTISETSYIQMFLGTISQLPAVFSCFVAALCTFVFSGVF